MNQSDLVKHVAESTGQTRDAVAKSVDAVLSTIMVALARGEDVSLKGFGSFEPLSRGERVGRNPKTGEPKTIPARKAPKFRPGKVFKNVINGLAPDAGAKQPKVRKGAPNEPALPGFE
jgi:DNA-binding protein HU-beta